MYYGYALSRAYAHDVFEVIKQKGLLNPDIGTRFVDCILAPGASKDAEQLLSDFLGRPACSDAYIAWLASLATES
jgi:thimet oligopeptidase